MSRIGIVAGLGILLLGSGICWSQAQSDVDTMRVVDAWGQPGDTAFVPISLVNTFNVSGISFRIVLNPDIAKPLYVEIAGTRVAGVYNYFGSQRDTINGWIYWFGLHFQYPDVYYVPPGSGPIALVACRIDPGAVVGQRTDVQFIDDVPGGYITSLSDPEGVMTIPIKRNGRLFVSAGPPNYPPEIASVPDTSVIPGQTLAFQVRAHDPNGDSLSLRGENLPANSSFPTAGGDSSVASTFTFSPSIDQAGIQYTVRFIATDDPGLADTLDVVVDVTAVANYPPSFQPIPGGNLQSVQEGEVLSFVVTAYDLDGDYLCVSAAGLPRNASFPEECDDSIVSGRFTFTPDFQQGPDTVNITFQARDALGATTNQRVDIIVIDVPYDIISADTVGGGLPAATQAPFSISLLNADSVYGLQFDLHYDGSLLTVEDIVGTSRLADFIISHNIGDSLGMLRVVVFSYDLSTIAPAEGPIMDVFCSVSPTARAGHTPLTFSNAIDVIDIFGTEREMLMDHGFFTVDTLGDVTLNLRVNVGDVVALVSYILGRISFFTRQLANADVNQDGNINVGDVVGVINVIMGRPVGPPLAPSPDYLAEAALLQVDPLNQELSLVLSPGVPIAGIQVTVEYDPSQVELADPVSTEITESFVLDSRNEAGRLTFLLYNFSGVTVPEGEWTVVRLPATRGTVGKVRLAEVVLADTIARVIPTKISSESTEEQSAIFLSQNYPNPFLNSTTIHYVVPSSSGGRTSEYVVLRIYNAAGSLVNTLVDREMSPGAYSAEWNGTDTRGSKVSSGIYFYNLRVGSLSVTKKMMVLR
ncbi:hypothetical protein AMJ40_04975 [candidate division TA06 bacterium DG_26]|uniref:Dockerin domain-containing protein n=1 Tax=candidate division TA06 bacterium DG_26 TaxID=1703771 RepID=A0A0S7WHQ7_UNCT6|nr:MAG: hypothetical protein AMJ40_04975 [candidate division TA06 bacterium DG_26]